MDEKDCPQFSLLPTEIQPMIWKYALQPTIVSHEPGRDWRPGSSGSTIAHALSRSNFLTRQLRERPPALAVLHNDPFGAMALDLEVDTLKVMSMVLPNIGRSPGWPPLGGPSNVIPIRKLLCSFYSTNIEVYRGLSSFWYSQHYRSIVYPHRRPLLLDRWPVLEEFTFAFTRADCFLFLDSYAVQGPDMNSVPSDDCYWHAPVAGDAPTAVGGVSAYDNSCEGAKYYESKGIKVDTGIRWSVDKGENPRNSIWDLRAQSAEISDSNSVIPISPWDFRPKVGLRGYHKNATSCGGMWAGFRYFADAKPRRVEFSPLPWNEVKDATYACQNCENTSGHFPEMIIKVFIVRQGQQPPTPEHCYWEEVGPPPPVPSHTSPTTISGDTIKIRVMWNMVKERFLAKTDRKSELKVLN